MQTAGGVMSLTCVSDLCSPEGAVLQGRLWSYCGVFPWYLLLMGANCFCFSSFSSLSFDTTLTPHSGSLIGTQEGDQETSPPAPNKNKNKTNRHSRPGDRYAPIYQLTPERAEGSRVLCPDVMSVIRWRHLKGWGNSNKFMKRQTVCSLLHLSKHHLPPPSSSSSACVLYFLPSQLCYGFSGKRVYCKISRL